MKKSNASIPISMKYNVDQEEIKDIVYDTGGTPGRSSFLERSMSTDDSGKAKKSASIINKYFKAFKSDKAGDEEFKTSDDNTERKSLDFSNESSGSPIKEYFNKFSRRSDSVDTNSDLDSVKEAKERDIQSGERWKLFSDFKSKLSQAVEDIKSSKSSECTDISKDKVNIIENSLTDSEDNSLHFDLDPNSCTENQVSSLASSIQNLSELSPPIISHSSTMTDMDVETSSSLETNKNIFEHDDNLKLLKAHTGTMKSISGEDTDDDNNEQLEVESGVDALEAAELVTTPDEEQSNLTPYTKPVAIERPSFPEDTNLEEPTFFNIPLIVLTLFLCTTYYIMPTFVMVKGFCLGIYASYLLNHAYAFMRAMMRFKDHMKRKKFQQSTKLSLSKIPFIVEFEPLKKYEGWINVYMVAKYDPSTYHISLTQTAFMKLEGTTLRLSFTHCKIPKHALWDEPPHKVPFHQHRIYNLLEAKINLLPSGIVKKRHWSKKYPICISLKDKSKVTVYNAKSESIDEGQKANTSTGKSDKLEDSNSDFDTNMSKDSPKRNLDINVEKSDNIVLSSSPKNVKTDLDTKKEMHTPTKSLTRESSEEITPEEIHLSPDEEYNDLKASPENEFTSKNWLKDDMLEFGSDQIYLYIFGRTGREKEEWFRRLKTAVDNDYSPLHGTFDEVNEGCETNKTYEKDDLKDDTKMLSSLGTESKVHLGSVKSEKKPGKMEMPSVLWTPSSTAQKTRQFANFKPNHDGDFWNYMKDIIETKSSNSDENSPNNNILWVNALIGRIVFDMFKNTSWTTMVQERIQKKLSSLKLPTFLGPLMVTALEFGPECPQFHDVSAPTLDVQGIWVDIQMTYNGRVTMTLTTQLNLMKLKEKRESLKNPHMIPQIIEPEGEKKIHAVYHSDLDDSAESSSEDEAILVQSLPPKLPLDQESPPIAANTGNSSAKKILRMVDRITASKYFQHVTEYKYVKRAMEGVSNTDLKLSVELCGLNGCLTINIPPPPSDRLWIGFRGSPKLWLKAKPVVGSHAINIAHLTTWIENKLSTEFEKILVLPNMEDFQFDCMIPPTIH